ncbi:MAG: cobalamin-dependent protein [Candidatus Bathyarchaeota archaeon]|nr:MAG: cobalamin-dependent protein [Candidatus Bathyarchaeota archaeon]
MKETEKLLEALFEAVVSGNIRKARRTAEKALHQGLSADTALEKMTDAMQAADRKCERKEYFVADVARSASAMREALKVFHSHLKAESANIAGKIVIGSLKGNLQSIGKDTVKATLRAAGFEVVDLGVDVPANAFVDAAIREKAQIIGVSISVDETVPSLKGVVDRLRQKNLADEVKIVIGGPAASESMRKTYGVDAYARDAWDCVRKVKLLLNSYKNKPVKR